MSAFKLIKLPTMVDGRGSLTVLDGSLPFSVKRCYWIYGVGETKRGGHRHHVTRQALVAIAGIVTIHMDDGTNRESIVLSSPDVCLIVEPKDWHTMNFGPDAILIAFASHGYDKSDYVYEPYQMSSL